MTMTLSPQIEALIQKKVKSGSFRDATEVVDEAIVQMDERDHQATLRSLRAEAEAELAQGKYIEWTPDLIDRLIRESEENSRKIVQSPDHVKP